MLAKSLYLGRRRFRLVPFPHVNMPREHHLNFLEFRDAARLQLRAVSVPLGGTMPRTDGGRCRSQCLMLAPVITQECTNVSVS